VRREFEPFDQEVIEAELEALPPKDAAKLVALMTHYEQSGFRNPSPAQIDDYGDGIFRLRHLKPAYSGRLLFFCVDRVQGAERLIILLVYKKEGQKVPLRLLGKAKERMKQWEQKRNK